MQVSSLSLEGARIICCIQKVVKIRRHESSIFDIETYGNANTHERGF